MNRKWLAAVLPLLGAACHHISQVKSVGTWTVDPAVTHRFEETDEAGNGIEVGEPKIYDDASLRLMLDQTRQRLAAVNGISEAGLTGRIGAITGATIDQSQFGIQAAGPGSPQSVTTDNGATSQTTANTGQPATMPSQVTVTNQPVHNVVTTAAAIGAPAPPTVPSGTAFTAPSGFSVSALDALNEQMQLTYELTNLQLLLEGSLSDRFVKNERFVKPRTTIGFPITLAPRPEYKNVAAVVEVEVITANPATPRNLAEPPAITALLPREKTYNVAAVKDHMTSIGAGAVVGLVGLSGSFLRGKKSYFLVRDQDTVALQRPPTSNSRDAVAFAWEFRPVLGQSYVMGGLKQTFVQLALPTLDTMQCYGSLRIRTYWRRFDAGHGIAGALIPETMLVSNRALSIPAFDLTPMIGSAGYHDLGDGTVLVEVVGKFLAGTYVRFGPQRFDPGNGLQMDDQGLKFVVSAASLARWTGQVVARSGESSPIVNSLVQDPLPKLDQYSCGDAGKRAGADTFHVKNASLGPGGAAVSLELERNPMPTAGSAAGVYSDSGRFAVQGAILSRNSQAIVLSAPVGAAGVPVCRAGPLRIAGDITATPLNDKDTKVSVTLEGSARTLPDPVLLEIGGKVFGLRDTVVKREGLTLEAVVPTALLLANPRVRAFVPFYYAPESMQAGLNPDQTKCYEDSRIAKGFEPGVSAEKIVLVSVEKNGDASYLLYGNRLDGVTVVSPSGLKVQPVPGAPPDRVGQFTLTKDLLATVKKLVLLKRGATVPIALDVPLPDAKPQPPKVAIDSPVIQNMDTVEVQVESLDKLTDVKLGDKSLPYDKGKNTIRLTQLKANQVTTEQKSVELSFEFGDTKVPLKFEVVAARIGVR